MSKRIIKNGNFRTIASISIGNEQMMPLKEFVAILNRAKKLLKVQKVDDPEIGMRITGVQNTEVQINTVVGKDGAEFMVIDGLENPRLHSVLQTNQMQLDENILGEKVKLAQENLKESVGLGNRIAQELAQNSVDIDTFHKMLGGKSNDTHVRTVIAQAAKSSLTIDMPDNDPISVGGRLAVPSQLSDEDTITISKVKILYFDGSGVFKVEQDKHEIEVRVQRSSNQFTLLQTAYAFECPVDILLIPFEKISNMKSRYELVEILNYQSLKDMIVNKIQQIQLDS